MKRVLGRLGTSYGTACLAQVPFELPPPLCQARLVQAQLSRRSHPAGGGRSGSGGQGARVWEMAAPTAWAAAAPHGTILSASRSPHRILRGPGASPVLYLRPGH